MVRLVSLDSETLKSFAPAVELAQVGQQYAAAITHVSTEICRKFQQRLAAKGLKLDGSGEALDLWNTTVDETLMAFNRSETFGDLQRRFLRSLMAYHLEQRWLVGRIAEHTICRPAKSSTSFRAASTTSSARIRRLRRAVARLLRRQTGAST